MTHKFQRVIKSQVKVHMKVQLNQLRKQNINKLWDNRLDSWDSDDEPLYLCKLTQFDRVKEGSDHLNKEVKKIIKIIK